MVKMSIEELKEELMAYPNVPIILNDLAAQLQEERKKREQFYKEITPSEKAEFINGEVVMHSPVKKRHNFVLNSLNHLMDHYVRKNKLGFVGIEKIMISLTRNDYEPDLCYFNQEKVKDFTEEQMLFPAPDLVVEVLSPSTAANDRGVKFQDYQAHQILEYWIIDPEAKTVEQFRLDAANQYELILKSGESNIESKAIKGFKINIKAIFDEEIYLEEVQRILKE